MHDAQLSDTVQKYYTVFYAKCQGQPPIVENFGKLLVIVRKICYNTFGDIREKKHFILRRRYGVRFFL